MAAWGCINRIKNGRAVCDSHHINEDLLRETYIAAFKEIMGEADDIIDVVESNIQAEVVSDNHKELKNIEQEIIELQDDVLKLHKQRQRGAITASAYEAKVQECQAEMDELEIRRKQLQSAESQFGMIKLWIDDFKKVMAGGSITEDNCDLIIKTLTDQIVVYDTYIEIQLKCGVVLKQEYTRRRRNFSKSER